MPVLYFDNFRGFSSTYISLKKVNFLVGENSTGKTSVLKLFRILSSDKFWHNLEFSSEEADLGYFAEIATDSKRPFEVGILGDNNTKQQLTAYKFMFFDREGLPSIHQVNFLEKGYHIEINFEGSEVKYRYLKLDSSQVAQVAQEQFFKNWIESDLLQGKEFKTLSYSTIGSFSMMFILIRFEIIRDIDDKDFNIDSFSISSLVNEMAWLAPIRTEPKRTYDSFKAKFHPDGTHAPYLLKSLLKNKRKTKSVETILKKFGKESGLFDEIKIRTLGKNQTSPFEIYITVNRVSQKITNVGYGVSQILPLIIEIIARDDNTWFAIQQPEIHLHPRGQAAFGEFIYKSLVKENKNFVIETHSDYTIDRFRLKVHEHFTLKHKEEISSQIVFFNRVKKGNSLSCIQILANGSLPSDQPESFRDFFIREELKLIKI